MRIIRNQLQNYIESLATAIYKDPASMENWRCLHISGTNDSETYATFAPVLDALKATHGDSDCDILHCPDNDVFFITRSLQPIQLLELASALMQALPLSIERKSDLTVYDLFYDWRTIHTLFHDKLKMLPKEVVEANGKAPHDFGEIASLSSVFEQAKLARKARMPLHVLVVEDDPITRRIVSNSFKENYAIITASTAEEALANYLIYAPDIVFLDIGLPDINGFDVLHRILESDPQAYVVMFSGNSYLDNVTSALATGAAGFIAKPFKKEKMQHYIESSAMHHAKQV